MKNWIYSGASVVGQSHLITSTPCQDKFQVQTSMDGAWVAVAVCDGAGSAEFAEQGASITSKHFCSELIRLSQELSTRTPGEWINDFVIDCVIRVREQLRKAAQSDDIRKYHCTLVAALMGKSGGFSIHIGDGAVFGGAFGHSSSVGEVELNSSFVISKPENGEYSNETYFITEGSWVKHLRVTPLPALDWLVACTDGGASLLLDNENEVKPSFLAPFVEAQVNNDFQDHQYIEEILADPKANKLTTDDKTIVLAVRNGVVPNPASFKFTHQQKVVTPSTPTSGPKIDVAVNQSTQKPTTPVSTQLSHNAVKNPATTPRKKNFPNQNKPRKKLIFGLSLLLLSVIGIGVGLVLNKDLAIKFGISAHSASPKKVDQLGSESKPTETPPQSKSEVASERKNN